MRLSSNGQLMHIFVPVLGLVPFQAANEVDVGRPLLGVDLQRSPIVALAHFATAVDQGADGSAREERAILLHRQHPETIGSYFYKSI